MKIPSIIINCKAYKEAVGPKAVVLARKILKISNVAIAVQPTDLFSVAQTGITTFAQHLDNVTYGPHTGAVLPEAAKTAGAVGTLLNHSERKIPLAALKETIQRAHSLGIITIACAATPREAQLISQLKPDAIAIEPPELIGGEISISQAKPSIITRTTHATNIPILCGAGVHNSDDVRKAIQLGAKGVLVAHAIATAKNPRKILQELSRGLN